VVDMNRSRLRVDAFRIEVSSSAFVVDSGVLRNQWATMAMPNENKAPTGRRLTKAKPVSTADRLLVLELRGLIEAAHQRVATAVNSELVLLYWRIGSQLRQEVLGGKRAQYGEVIVSTCRDNYRADYAVGFSRQNLFHMICFAGTWPDESKVAQLADHLGWSHFKEILYLEDPLQRDFYAEMSRLERWSVRTLRERVKGMLYERTAIYRLPAPRSRLWEERTI
jgi:hypothetical protein